MTLLTSQKTLGGVPAVEASIGGSAVDAFVYSYEYSEATGGGECVLWLDNRGGEFNDLAAGWPNLTRGAVVQIDRGLVLSGAAITAPLPRLWVEGFEYVNNDGVALLAVSCIDWQSRLDAYRYSSVQNWSAAAVKTIAASIVSTVGLTLASGAWSTGLTLDFEIDLDESAFDALERLMSKVPEFLYAGMAGELLWKEFDPNEAAGYDYAWESDHPVLFGTESAFNSPKHNSVTINATEGGFSGSDSDAAEIALVGTRLLTLDDATAASNAECEERAAAELTFWQAQAKTGLIVARPNFTLSLFDMVSLDAPAWGGVALTAARVSAYRERYGLDRWEQAIELGDLPASYSFAPSGGVEPLKPSKPAKPPKPSRGLIRWILRLIYFLKVWVRLRIDVALSDCVLRDGTKDLTADWDAGDHKITVGDVDLSHKLSVDGEQVIYDADAEDGLTGTLVLGDGGQSLTTGYNNTLVGKGAGQSLTTGAQNTLVGADAGQSLTTGYRNTLVGRDAGESLVEGYSNTFVGREAGESTTSGRNNVAIGQGAGAGITTGLNNTIVGTRAGEDITLADLCTFVGYGAGSTYVTGGENTAVGYLASAENTGSGNTAFGYRAGGQATTSSENTLIGAQAAINVSGDDNSVMGYTAGLDLTSGQGNTFLGHNTGRGVTTGSYNTIVGAGVTGLAAGLSNHVIIADGQGNQRIRIDGSGNAVIGATSHTSGKLDVNGDINTRDQFLVDGTQVVTNRQTGWTAATGTADRSTFATGSVSLSELAERVKALLDDLTTHGLIGA